MIFVTNRHRHRYRQTNLDTQKSKIHTTTYPHEHRIIYCCHIVEQDDLGGLRLLSSSLASWRFSFADALKLRVLSRANCDCVTIKLEFKKFGIR